MTKLNFILELHDRLSSLPQKEIEERIDFYVEMIEDRMEEGIPEEEAVADIGTIDEIADQIIADVPLTAIVKKTVKSKKKLKVWEIVLISAGFPVWLPLLISAFAVILALYAVFWAIIISLWAVFASFCACALGGIASGAGFCFTENLPVGIAMIAAGIVLAGLSILMFYACKLATKGTLVLTKKIALFIKKCFMKKEVA